MFRAQLANRVGWRGAIERARGRGHGRRGMAPPVGSVGLKLKVDAATTDARLSCPGCFALVCVLCQRHERYKGQYRAVFARGVETSTTSCLRPTDDDSDGADERYREVTCAQCGTVVAVQDDDDVYHFFNVFSAG